VKYVILQATYEGYARLYPIIFTPQIVHAAIAGSYAQSHQKIFGEELKVVAAGFCSIVNDQWKCERGSESLEIKKNPLMDEFDASYLNMPEAMQGIIV